MKGEQIIGKTEVNIPWHVQEPLYYGPYWHWQEYHHQVNPVLHWEFDKGPRESINHEMDI